MGWAIGFDENWGRDIGYSIPAYCDHPSCNKQINRGLSYVCADQEPYGGEGCGLYFCEKHKGYGTYTDDEEEEPILSDSCLRCSKGKDPYKPKPEHPTWVRWKLVHPSWASWREECPDEVKEFQDRWDELLSPTQAKAIASVKKEMEYETS